MRRFLLVGLMLLAAGCLPGGTREAPRYYVLDVPEPTTGPARVPRPATLIVPETSAESFYDTQDLVYSRSPGTRAYYQFNSWTERPSRRIHALLVSRLEQSGVFRTVAGSERGAGEGVVLRTHLEQIYHDAAQPPGTARIVLRAELVDPGRSVVARRTFTESAAAKSYDAPGAVSALRQALEALLDEVVAWVDEAV